MDLPLTLRTALEETLASIRPSELAAASRDLSDRYRRPGAGAEHIRSESDVLAYGAFRLPATYAAVSAAMRETRKAMPHWHPSSLLDVGAGPGTSSWAGSEEWTSVADVELVEANERMIALGRTLMRTHPVLQAASWNRSDLLLWTPGKPRDLVVASYVLGEIDAPRRCDLVHSLWDATADVLVLVEPGTPAGFEVIRTARAQLIQLEANIVAPCPHSTSCPMSGSNWCHFSVRLARSRAHREAKRVNMGYEDEKYSYVAVARSCFDHTNARVLRHPQVRPGHIRLELCTRDGLERAIISKRDKERFRAARDVTWGGTWTPGQVGAE